MSDWRRLSRPEMLHRLRRPALAVAGGALVLLILGGVIAYRGGDQFFRSWLFAWIFWLGVTLGAMGIVMMHHLIGGEWGYMIRRLGEVAAQCMPLMLVLFIPLIIGVRHVYPWADPAQLAENPVLRHKAAWLNLPFWTVRSVVFLLIWIAMAWMLRTDDLERPGVDVEPIYGRLNRISAIGTVIYFVTMSIAAVDWIMSREPEWHSTIFGFIVCVSQALSGCCLLILLLWVFHDREPLNRVVSADRLNDIGNVLLTFVILWAYMSFAQFLVIWVGNKQDEIVWYIRRTDGGWRWVGAALILFHFFVPFFLLLQRPMKRRMNRLALTSAALLVIHVIDELYWVTPSDPHGWAWGVGRWFFTEAMNLMAFLAVGGIWLATFLWILDGKALLPAGDRVPVIPVDHGHGQRSDPRTVG